MAKRKMDTADSCSCSRTSGASLGPAEPPPSAPLSSLPAGVLELILRCLVAADVPEKLYPKPFNLAKLHRALAVFRLLSRDWYTLTASVEQRWTSHVAWIDVNGALAQKKPQHARGSSGSVDENPSAADLRLVMRSVVTVLNSRCSQSYQHDWFTIPTDLDQAVQLQASQQVMWSVGSIQIDWTTLLQPRTASLVRLDLSEMPLDCVHLGRVLLAASTHCQHIRVLSLPKQTPRFSEDNEARESNMNELYGALQRWRRANGGLVHLRIPFGRFDENTAVRLLRALTAYCPEIEYLDGWQDTYRLDGDGQTSCEAYWPAPVPLWERFWATCKKLRTFNTVMMPFDDDYLLTLGEAGASCGLESLVVAMDSAKARHHEVHQLSMFAVLFAFPHLQFLHIEVPFVSDDVWDPRESIDDSFLRVLKIKCPQLRQLRVQCADPRVLFKIGFKGLSYLISLPDLEVIEIQQLETLAPTVLCLLLYTPRQLRLGLSIASGQVGAWNLLRSLAETTLTRRSAFTFSLSLTRLECTKGQPHPGVETGSDDGIRAAELSSIVHAIHENMHGDVKLHAHTTRQNSSLCTNEARVVDLEHLELCLNDPDGFGLFRQEKGFRVRSRRKPVCALGCLAPTIVEDQ